MERCVPSWTSTSRLQVLKAHTLPAIAVGTSQRLVHIYLKDAYIHVLYIFPSMGGFGTWKLTLLGGGPDTGTVRQGRRIVNYRAFFSVRILGAPLGTDASAYQWPQWPRPQASGSMHSSGGRDPRRTGGFGTNDRRYGICGFDP